MRTRMTLMLAMVLLLSLTATSPAAGGPDIDCEVKPNHPACPGDDPTPDHPDGGTCEASGDAWIAETDGFTAVFTEKLLCVDWTTTKAADWRITVWPNTGAKASVWATVRDSHPGDWCWRADDAWQEIDTPDGLAVTAVMSAIPAAAIDACGTEYTDLADPPADAIPFVLGIGYKFKSSGVVVTVEEIVP